MTPEHASIVLERATGYDSIPTITEHYRDEPWSDEHGGYRWNGRYRCVVPGCEQTTKGAAAMWRHVHFTSHGKAFVVDTVQDAIALAERIDAEDPV